MTQDSGPIRHLVVLGHPAVGSVNHALAHCYCETVRACGQEAELRNLYAIGFDPLLKASERPSGPDFEPAPDVAAELELLGASDAVCLIYPIWFGMPPAIIKGYVDRVLGAGFGAGAIKQGVPHPMLANKQLVMITTSATTRPWLEEQGQWASLRQAFDTYLATIFGFAGHEHMHFDTIVSGSKPRYIDECLEEARGRVRAICAALASARHSRRNREVLGA